MIGESKFDYSPFIGEDGKDYFAVNRQKYSKLEIALELFKKECDNPERYQIKTAYVRWGTGKNILGERSIGWWLDFETLDAEKRLCPVWVFEY